MLTPCRGSRGDETFGQQALYFRREWRHAVGSWFRGDVRVSGRSHTAVNSGEHMVRTT
jgi:hypothetical protein